MAKRILKSNECVLIVLIAVLLVAFYTVNPAVLSLGNVFSMCSSATLNAIFALPVLLIFVSGGIDLSFMAIASFIMFTTTKILLNNNWNPSIVIVFLIGIGMGIGLGCINALFVNAIKLPIFIVTLATQFLFDGSILAFVGTGKQVVPGKMADFGKMALLQIESDGGRISTLRATVLIVVVLYILIWLLLWHTRLGRNFYLIGGDMQAAERAGINVKKTYVLLFVIVGAICGIGGIVNACTLRTVIAGDLIGGEMPVIAAVIIGGANAEEGKGNVVATLLGVILITVISNNLTILKVPSYMQEFILGIFIILSTVSQVLRNRQKYR
ncbi:MAG: ABC transporter permease [Lachnospiraceae bacterium]|nr:ABC transporter permease [Lachnospiraceae bacterium]